MRPKRTKRDSNHAEIRDGLRQLGAIVWDTADLGGEILDLLVFWQGKCVPVEVKPLGRESDLTEGERKSIEMLRVVGIEAVVATRVEDVIEALRVESTGADAVKDGCNARNA